MVRELATRLSAEAADEGRPIELTGYLVSVRGRRALADALPAGWQARPTPYPARLVHKVWQLVDRPTVCADHDLVHGTNYVVPPGARTRLVTVHDLTAWRFPELVDDHSRRYPDLVDRAVRTGAHVHVVSAHVRDEVIHDLAVPSDRVHHVANGYTAGPAGNAAGGRSRIGRPYLLAVGTIEPRKDHVTLVRALARILADRPDGPDLVLAGPEGWGSDPLDREVAALGLAPRIHRLGWVTAQVKADLLAGAEALVFPSLYEGFGLPVLEAMGAGVPVVATDIGAVSEVAGDAALLVPTGDADRLAEAVLTAVEDGEERSRLIAAGRTRVDRFNWDDSATAMATLYRTLTGSLATLPTA